MNVSRALATSASLLVLALASLPLKAEPAGDASGAASASAGGDASLGYSNARVRAGIDNPGAHTHDGFYLRMAVGGGYVHDNLKYDGPILQGLVPDGQAEGGSFQGDLAAGWAVKPGLVIGGQLFIEQLANPRVTFGGRVYSSDISVGTLTVFGPLIDWYPNAHKGFHFGGMIGGSRVTMQDNSRNQLDNQPIGAGGMAFVGYEWWTGEQWAMGGMLQFSAASMNDSSNNMHHTWTSGGLAVSLTYN